MRYGPLDRPQTGLAFPLSSLRSPGHGIGEFADLVPLGEWAATVGLDVLQILPVQDTGRDPSPYAGVSSLALHPIYLRVEEVEGSEAVRESYLAAQAPLAALPRVDYAAVLESKMRALREILERLDHATVDERLRGFVEQNPWLEVHAAYKILEQRHSGRPWHEWEDHRDPQLEDLSAILESDRAEARFQIWLQWEADRQLRAAAEAMDARGLRLKGDIPILMHENSVDVWFHRELFDRSVRAGAPPDMYSDEGQNWGFPCYRWKVMAENDHAWWRRRVRRAARYFHALRIDHVLGFFRIWYIPADRRSGRLGVFDPTVFLERGELHEWGLDDEFIDWLASPGDRRHDHSASELEILEIEDDDERRRRLDENADRVLLDVDGRGERFVPVWDWRNKPLFRELPHEERDRLGERLRVYAERCEALWESVGRHRLSILSEETEMLICAEDLGAVPACVGPVLRELGILGLRVERWCREWDTPGQPFVDPVHYDTETVCSPGVHDAASLRGWWAANGEDRQVYWNQALGREGAAPEDMDADLLAAVFERNLRAASRISVLALPDCLALDPRLRPGDPAEERINVPGTPSEKNWNYRMPVGVEELGDYGQWVERLAELIARRNQRAL